MEVPRVGDPDGQEQRTEPHTPAAAALFGRPSLCSHSYTHRTRCGAAIARNGSGVNFFFFFFFPPHHALARGGTWPGAGEGWEQARQRRLPCRGGEVLGGEAGARHPKAGRRPGPPVRCQRCDSGSVLRGAPGAPAQGRKAIGRPPPREGSPPRRQNAE